MKGPGVSGQASEIEEEGGISPARAAEPKRGIIKATVMKSKNTQNEVANLRHVKALRSYIAAHDAELKELVECFKGFVHIMKGLSAGE